MEYLNSLKLLWNYIQAVSEVFDALIQPSKNSNYFDYVNVRISWLVCGVFIEVV